MLASCAPRPTLPTPTLPTPLSTAPPTPGLEEAIASGLVFLRDRYDPAYHLLNESPVTAPDRYWLATDNWLAAHALRVAGDGSLAETVSAAVGDIRHGLIEALDGEILPWPPHVETQTQVDGGIWTETRLAGPSYADWQEYADLALYAAIVAHNRNEDSEARRLYRQALALFDGIGFADKAYLAPGGHGLYATYKLALAIYVGAQIEEPLDRRLLPALLAKQDDSGGFVTLYQGDGAAQGDANTETTSYAILALAALRQQVVR